MNIPLIQETTVETPKIDLNGMFARSFVNVNEKMYHQPVCISIGESTYKQQRYPIPFGSYGDYSCIVGSSKGKKTFLKSALIAGYIGGNSNSYFPNILGHEQEQKYVIDIDTEQSRYHSQRVFKRVVEMVGGDYKYYKPFSLREYSPFERLEFIDYLFNESEFKGNIGLMSIDGYADLVSDFNNLEQSLELSEKLLKWSSKNKCHITGVLHKNFGSSKPVGHVGSTILKKAETVVFLDNQDEFTSVECKYSRNIPFDNFNFNVNEEWIPYEI